MRRGSGQSAGHLKPWPLLLGPGKAEVGLHSGALRAPKELRHLRTVPSHASFKRLLTAKWPRRPSFRQGAGDIEANRSIGLLLYDFFLRDGEPIGNRAYALVPVAGCPRMSFFPFLCFLNALWIVKCQTSHLWRQEANERFTCQICFEECSLEKGAPR